MRIRKVPSNIQIKVIVMCTMMMMKNGEEGNYYDDVEIIQIKGTGHNVGEICWLRLKIYSKTWNHNNIGGEQLKNLEIEKSIEPSYIF